MTGMADAVRAAVQVAPGKIEVQEFARPKVEANTGLLKIEACGLCGSDISQLDGLYHENDLAGMPCIPGHEPLGVIEEIGPLAEELWGVKVGDRVAVEAHLACGHCAPCLRGDRVVCENGEHKDSNYGFISAETAPGLWGGYAEYMHLDPRTVMHKVSKDLSPSTAVMFNPVGGAIRWTVAAPSLEMGDSIAILGSGQRGLGAVLAAKTAGASLVIATDLAQSAHKLELAMRLGADHVIVADEEDPVERVLNLTGGKGVDVVLDVTPRATKPITDAIKMVRNGGTVVLAGVKNRAAVPDFISDDLVFRSIRLQGVFAVDSRSYVEAIRLIEREPAVFELFGTRNYPLGEAEEAIARLAGRDGAPPALHVALRPWMDREQGA